MKLYETMFVLKATLTEEETKAKVEAMKSLLEKNGAEITLLKEYGVRPLAYEIDKNKRGYFTDIFFKAPPEAVIELERVYRITEDVIRFITVKFESKKEIQAWETGSKSGNTSILKPVQRSYRRDNRDSREGREGQRDNRERKPYQKREEGGNEAPVAAETSSEG